jgi:hypothetical protein
MPATSSGDMPGSGRVTRIHATSVSFLPELAALIERSGRLELVDGCRHAPVLDEPASLDDYEI